jgi:hypothetical protein
MLYNFKKYNHKILNKINPYVIFQQQLKKRLQSFAMLDNVLNMIRL